MVITVLPKDYALAPSCTPFSTGRTYTIPILSHLEYFGLRLYYTALKNKNFKALIFSKLQNYFSK